MLKNIKEGMQFSKLPLNGSSGKIFLRSRMKFQSHFFKPTWTWMIKTKQTPFAEKEGKKRVS